MKYFLASVSSATSDHAAVLENHGHAAFAGCGKTRLALEGLIYEICGEGQVPRGLSRRALAEWCLAAYRRNPHRFFERLRGQCTVGVLDSASNRIRIYRSRLSPHQVYFTGDSASNRLFPVYRSLRDRQLDLDYFRDFMNDRESLHYGSPYTPIRNVRRLGSGESLTLQPGVPVRLETIDERTPVEPFASRPGQTVTELADSVRQLLERAIDARLPAESDPVVCQLSGGLDSSFVTALVAKRRPNVTAYLYSFPDRRSHEFSLNCARTVARDLGISLSVVDPRDIPKTDLGARQPYVDEPHVAFWQGALFAPVIDRIVPDGGTLFTGFGADQIFLPDTRLLPWLLRRGDLRNWIARVGDAAKSMERSRAHLAWQTLLMALPARVYGPLARAGENWRFNPFALEEMNPDDISRERVDWLKGTESQGGMATGASRLEFSYLVAPELSTTPFLDIRSARLAHPYCDARLIDFVTEEIGWEQLHDWKAPYKNLLREAMRDVVPETVRNREKNEFYFDGFLSQLLKDNEVVLRELLNNVVAPRGVEISVTGVTGAFELLVFGVISHSTQKTLNLLSYLLWWRDFSQTVDASAVLDSGRQFASDEINVLAQDVNML